ncbi:hypothetical protein EC991_000765 [Linnemannia zychae]|nr:hypothetical protein EC991_000765 [Linnemannia zychae]
MRIHEDDHFQSFLKQCPPSFPLLTAADIKAPFEDDYNYTKNDVLRFANMSSEGWKRLVFRKDKEAVTVLEFNKRPFDQLLKVVAPTLQVFRTYSLRLVNMRAVNKLLCTAPNLKELYIYIGSDGAEEYWLDAEEIVDSEWVCDNLEVFGCRIGNIPRPDITRDVDGVPWADYFGQGLKEESINLQHQVYAKLARFTKLRELSLGFPLNSEDAIYDSDYTEHYQQYDCLAMTVDSGLDLLKGLQNLRNVGLTNMTAYIAGEKEKAWFKENWPNVKFEVFDEIANEENEDSSEEEWLTEDDEDHHFSE